MIRIGKNIFSFAKSSQFNIYNIFNRQCIGKFTSPSDQEMTHILHQAKVEQQKWRNLPSQDKQKKILRFIDQFEKGQALSRAASLLSASTGKQLLECEAELKKAIKIFNYQLGYLWPKDKPFGSTSYRFEPFDCITSVFDHRHPFIAAFSYFALALRSNNSLFLRASPSVIPAISYITSLWRESTQSGIVSCLLDAKTDPKHKDSLVRTILRETGGFISFWGRLKDGLNFHYYMSQSNESFLENQFMLTSSDSAYVMKDLNSSQLQKAALQVARGSFSNCGHNFNSIKRLFVDREISQQFQHLLLNVAKQYTISNSIRSDFSTVSLNDGKLAPYLLPAEFQQSRKLLQQIKEKHSNEISVLQGGEAVVLKAAERQLSFITPAVLRVQTDFPTFSYQNIQCMMPICFLSVVDSPQSCIEKINSSIFGTTATIFCNSFERALEIGEKLEVGTVNLNTWELEEGIPYSGRKRSGKGFSLSPLSFNNIVRSKSLSFP